MNAQSAYLQVQAASPDELVTRHAELVKRIAYHLVGRLPPSVEVEDLIQAGMIGLLEAAAHYTANKGANFETYAGIRIRGAMLDELRKTDWTPRSVHRKVREAAEVIRRIENRTGREAGDKEVAQELGVSVSEYQRIVQDAASCRLFSLDAAMDGDDETGLQVAGDGDEPLELLEEEGFQDALAAAIGNLPEREKLVMSLYYEKEMNLREIGEVLSVSESRVCQIHGQALVRLRARLGSWQRDKQ